MLLLEIRTLAKTGMDIESIARTLEITSRSIHEWTLDRKNRLDEISDELCGREVGLGCQGFGDQPIGQLRVASQQRVELGDRISADRIGGVAG